MKERSIILTQAEAIGVNDGSRVQLRRVVKVPRRGAFVLLDDGSGLWPYESDNGESGLCNDGNEYPMRSPFGQPGDRLRVRETFWTANDVCDHECCSGCDMGSMLDLGPDYADVQYVATPECCNPPSTDSGDSIGYVCDGDHAHGQWWLSPPDDWDGDDDYHGRGVWVFMPTLYATKHPSVHMPCWASRATLEVKRVWVERDDTGTWVWCCEFEAVTG